MNLNKALLIGRLGKDPEVNYIKPDTPVAKFSIATSESYKSRDGERKEITEWHNIVAWRNTAKYCESYLEKGMLIYVEGKIQTRKWEGKDGVTRYSTDIVADQIKILERKSTNNSGNSEEFKQTTTEPKPTAKPETPATGSFEKPSDNFKSDVNDDLPF